MKTVSSGITLIPPISNTTHQDIQKEFGKDKTLIVCDFYINKIESLQESEKHSYGFSIENIINIDHHAPIETMERKISSTPLAIEFVNKFGIIKDVEVIINHTDCDSILSSAIIKGLIPPEEKFYEASIAADHTGEPNELADILQALKKNNDLEHSLQTLKTFLKGEPLDKKTQEIVTKNLGERTRAKKLVESGVFNTIGKIAYAEITEVIEGALLPSLLPDSWIIVIAAPYFDNKEKVPGRYQVKVRLGVNAPRGLTLQKLELDKTEINLGGRWNAGNNNRSGGSSIGAKECAHIINDKLDKLKDSY